MYSTFRTTISFSSRQSRISDGFQAVEVLVGIEDGKLRWRVLGLVVA